MAVNNKYTSSILTTPPIITGNGFLNNPSVFPLSTTTISRITFTPKPGEEIRAANFIHVKHAGMGNFELSLSGTTNSHTQWPSRFQLTAPGLGTLDPTTTSGYKEVPGVYKVVFEDSTNPNNNLSWLTTQSNAINKVYMWVYIGNNETTAVDSSSNITVDLDIDYDVDGFELSDTVSTVAGSGNNLNNFNI